MRKVMVLYLINIDNPAFPIVGNVRNILKSRVARLPPPFFIQNFRLLGSFQLVWHQTICLAFWLFFWLFFFFFFFISSEYLLAYAAKLSSSRISFSLCCKAIFFTSYIASILNIVIYCKLL